MSTLEKNPSDFLTNLRNNCDEIISHYTIPDMSSAASAAIGATAAVGLISGGILGAFAGAVLGGVLLGNSQKGAKTASKVPSITPTAASCKPHPISDETEGDTNKNEVAVTIGEMPKDLIEKIEEAEEHLDIYSDILFHCEKKNIDEVELYTKAFVSKTVFSKIRSMKTTGYKPSKSTIVCLCLALNLNILETQALLNKAGYILSNEIFTDKIISYCIEKSFFNIYEIESLLSEKVNRPVLFKA